MPRDLRQLPKDFRKLVTEARAEAAAEIQESLMNRSPFWTGTFAESWIVSGSEVQATRPRQGDFDPDQDETPVRLASSIFRDTSQKGDRIYQALTSPVFIGNEADYAAFVINKAKLKGEGIMYSALFKKGSRTTPRPNVPNWYDVYTKSKEIFKDIDKGFRIKGFLVKTTKPAGSY
jgi:hypothetical protein